MTRPPQRLRKQRSPSTYTAENGIAAALRDLKTKQRLRVEGEHSERAEEVVLR